MVTLKELISPAKKTVVEPVTIIGSVGWQNILSKINPAKIFGRAAGGISTSVSLLMKMKGIVSCRIYKNGWV